MKSHLHHCHPFGATGKSSSLPARQRRIELIPPYDIGSTNLVQLSNVWEDRPAATGHPCGKPISSGHAIKDLWVATTCPRFVVGRPTKCGDFYWTHLLPRPWPCITTAFFCKAWWLVRTLLLPCRLARGPQRLPLLSRWLPIYTISCGGFVLFMPGMFPERMGFASISAQRD